MDHSLSITRLLRYVTNKVAVLSTQKTEPMYVGGKMYSHYPKVEINMPKDKLSINFIDTVTMSNLYLAGLGGDYDGDRCNQVSSAVML